MYSEIEQHLTEFAGRPVRDFGQRVLLLDGSSELAPDREVPRLSATFVELSEDEPRPSSAPRWAAIVAVIALTVIGMVFWAWWAVIVGLVAVTILLPPSANRPRYRDVSCDELLGRLLEDPSSKDIDALVVGVWNYDHGTEFVADALVGVADHLPNLRHLFLGDVTSEECEISWIERSDLGPFLEAFPKLETLYVRGATGLRFTSVSHHSLRKLVIQSGGMDTATLDDLAVADLPELEHLELWLGDTTYGFDATIEDLRPFWTPGTFPALTTLGLRNCELADEIAEQLALSPDALAGLERLDLSLGTLSDRGAAALYNNPAITGLEELDLHYHFMSDDWARKLESLPLEIDVSDAQYPYVPDDGYDDERYVAVGE